MTVRRSVRPAALLGMILPLFVGAEYSFAQTLTETVPVDEIIVTARKRAENVQRVPLAITTFDAQELADDAIRNIEDIAQYTPGFSFGDEFGRVNSNRPVIRGQATILGESGVSTFVDGVLLKGSLLDYGLNDVERIEVIKGPQSVLYGRNTYAGAINITTKSPTEDREAELKASVGSHDYLEVYGAVRGPISDSLSGSLAGRYYERGGPFTNTYNDSEVGQQESQSLSGVLYYEPNDDLSVRMRSRWSKLHDDQLRNFLTDVEDNNRYQDNGGVYNGNYSYYEGEITELPINMDDVRNVGQPGYDDVESLQNSISVDYALNDKYSLEFIGGLNFDKTEALADYGPTPDSLNQFSVYLGPVFPFSIPGYFAHAYVVSGPASDFAIANEGNAWDGSAEFRVNYASDRWRGLVGAYAYTGTSKTSGNRQAPDDIAAMIEEGFNRQVDRMTALCAVHANDFGTPCYSTPFFSSIFNFGQPLQAITFGADRSILKNKRDNLAVFASVSFDPTEKLELTVEGRLGSETLKSLNSEKTANHNYLGTFIGFDEAQPVDQEETFNSFTPRFSARYDAFDHTNIYGVIAKGTKPGGFNSLNFTGIGGFSSYDEEQVWSLEAGTKSTFLDDMARFNLSAYYNTIDDYQLTQTLATQTEGAVSIISNIGKVRVSGFEADLDFKVPGQENLRLIANYAYAKSKVLEGTDVTEGKLLDVADDGLLNCSTGTADPDFDCLDGDNVLPGSIVGRQLPRQPKHMANIGFIYEQDFKTDYTFIMGTNLSYESHKYVQVQNLAYYGESLIVNGNIGLEVKNARINLWGRNLTGEDSVVSASRFIDESRSFQRAFRGQPRVGAEYGMSLGFLF